MEPTIEAADPLIGAQIGGKLRIEAMLGAGATGKVYRARHTGLDRLVAIKVLSTSAVIRNPTTLERFRLEARAASRIDHPNVVRVLDFGEDGPEECWYIVMELVEGEDLGHLLDREGPLPPARAKQIAVQTLDALAAAHAAGIVHRDVKPRNILRLAPKAGGTEQIKVCDFGLAKLLEGSQPGPAIGQLTRVGVTLGTPAFMAPEQVLGATVDERTDVYAVGALLFKLLTGEAPFAARDRSSLFQSILQEQTRNPSSLSDTVDAHLDAVVKRALEKKPEHRFQSAQAMREALLAPPPKTSPAPLRPGIAPALERIRQERSRARRASWLLIAGLGMLSVAAAIGGMVLRSPAPEVIEPAPNDRSQPAPQATAAKEAPAQEAEAPEEWDAPAAQGDEAEPEPSLVESEQAPAPAPTTQSRTRAPGGPRVVLLRLKAPAAVEATLRQTFEAQIPNIERCLSQATTDDDEGALVVAVRAAADHFQLMGVRDQIPGATQPVQHDSEGFVSNMRACLAPVFQVLQSPASSEPLTDVRAAFRFRSLSPR